MGLRDRDYMRRAPEGAWSATSWTARIVVVLVVAWLAERGLDAFGGVDAARWLALSRDALLHGRVWTLVTYAVVHQGIQHLVWNCFGIWVFGGLAEGLLPPREYARMAVWSAVAAGVGHLAAGPVFGGVAPSVVGASGVLMAFVVFAALRQPRFPIGLFLLPVSVPLWLLAVLYVAGDLWGVGVPRDGIAHGAHLGGAAYGVLVHFAGVWPRLPTFGRRRAAQRAAPSDAPHAERARVDALLEKIARDGIGALSAEERRFLETASKRYR